MKAMILAAGLGTRLKPLTDTKPKALVEVKGEPMLAHVIRKLKQQGFDYIVVNVHHFSNQVIKYLNCQDFGVEVVVSDESDTLLDTGGGIVKAAPLIFRYDEKPVLVHNVDIISNADLSKLIKEEEGESYLLVSQRDSSRKLLFDKEMGLRGWHDLKNDIYRPEGFYMVMERERGFQELAFSGIYSLTKDSIDEMSRLLGRGKYSVMEYFLHPERKVKISGLKSENLKVLDIGKPASLAQASEMI